MSAVCQDSRELGRSAYELLLQLCEGSAIAPQEGLGKAWLEINHSTGQVLVEPVRIMPNGERLSVAG